MMRLRMVNTRSEIEFSEPCSTRRMGFLSVQHLGTCAGRGLGILASHVLTRCVARVVGAFGRRKILALTCTRTDIPLALVHSRPFPHLRRPVARIA